MKEVQPILSARKDDVSGHNECLRAQIGPVHADVGPRGRDVADGQLRSQQIDGKGEYPPFLYDADG